MAQPCLRCVAIPFILDASLQLSVHVRESAGVIQEEGNRKVFMFISFRTSSSFCGVCLIFIVKRVLQSLSPVNRNSNPCAHDIVALHFRASCGKKSHIVRLHQDSKPRPKSQKDSRLPPEPPGRPAVGKSVCTPGRTPKSMRTLRYWRNHVRVVSVA